MIFKIESKEHWLKLRSEDITSTDCAVLFGLSKYKTLYELWHEKKEGHISSFEETERMKWGSRLEPVIAAGVAEDLGLTVKPLKEYHRHDQIRAGSSFDFITTDNQILEIKNVDSLVYRNEWTDDEAPPHIELQVQHQMLVYGNSNAIICALIGGNELRTINRKADPDIQKLIIKKINEFWQSIDNNKPPEPEWSADAGYIISRHSFAEPGTVLETDEMLDLVLKYKKTTELLKKIESKKEEIKAKIMVQMGTYEKAKGEKYSISAGMIGESEVSYTRKAYRNFKVFIKGDKSK